MIPFPLKFTAQRVALATGATPKQITDWCNQGLVIGQREPLGRGHKREFSWFNVMEVAIAMAIMDVLRSSQPGDAFRAAQRFSHTSDGGTSWAGDDGISDDAEAHRVPGLPFHHDEGETYLYVSGERSTVALHKDGVVPLGEILRALRKPLGFVALNLSELFMIVAHRAGIDGREVLDANYRELELAS